MIFLSAKTNRAFSNYLNYLLYSYKNSSVFNNILKERFKEIMLVGPNLTEVYYVTTVKMSSTKDTMHKSFCYFYLCGTKFYDLHDDTSCYDSSLRASKEELMLPNNKLHYLDPCEWDCDLETDDRTMLPSDLTRKWYKIPIYSMSFGCSTTCSNKYARMLMYGFIHHVDAKDVVISIFSTDMNREVDELRDPDSILFLHELLGRVTPNNSMNKMTLLQEYTIEQKKLLDRRFE